MKLVYSYRILITTKDFRDTLEILDKAGINTEENSTTLMGLTFNTLLEVFRKANVGNHSEIMKAFTKEAQQLRAVWNVSSSSTRQEQVEIGPVRPLKDWASEDLITERMRLMKLNLPGCEKRIEKIDKILKGRE